MPYLTERELSPAAREKIPSRLFVFPKDRTWPIHTLKQAKTALTWSRWPQHRAVSKKVRETVFKFYPALKKWFLGGKYAKEGVEPSASVARSQDVGTLFEELQELLGK
jgi:hypothetical protein